MPKSGIRAAVQESIPIGYLPARAKYIHDRGCQVGGKTHKNRLKRVTPKQLKRRASNIKKYYSKKKKRRQKGGLAVLNKPELVATIVLLVLNALARRYPKYKAKGGSLHKEAEPYRSTLSGLKKDTLVQIAGSLMQTVPISPSDARYSEYNKIVGSRLGGGTRSGGYGGGVNQLTVVTLIFLLQQIIDKKWRKKSGGGCGCGSAPSNKRLLSEIERVTSEMKGGAGSQHHTYEQTETGCIQPDWCAQCI